MGGDVRVAMVTGASEGIGEAISGRLCGLGYRVAMVARRSDKLDRAVADVGEGAFAVPCDLSSPEEIAGAVDAVGGQGGRIDALVNCASTTRFGSALALSDAEWMSGFEVKVFGALRLMRAVWPLSRPPARSMPIALLSLVDADRQWWVYH